MHPLRVVIAGYGQVGRRVARFLELDGHTVSVIDKNPLAFYCDDADEIAGQKLVGSASDREVLEDAGIRDVDCFVAVASSDNNNMVAARTAKGQYHVPRVVARIHDPNRAEICRGWGIATISPAAWTSARLLGMVAHPDLHSEYQYGDADMEMMEVPLPAGLVGKRVGDLAVPGEIAVATIVREGKGILPEPGTTFQKDDTLFVNVLRESAAKLEGLLGLNE